MLKRLATFVFTILCGIVVFSAPAHAEGGVNIEISPVSNYFTIKPGDDQVYTLTIKNNGNSEFKYRLYTAPYVVSDEEYTLNFDDEAATSYNQITRWVTFKNSSGSFVKEPTFVIEPGQEQLITYKVSVPDNIPEGGQYGIIFAETVNDNKEGGINAVSRVALSLIGHGTGSTKNTAEITEYNMTHPFSKEGISAGAKVKNTGNTDFEAVYTLTVKSIFNKILYEANSSYTVLPETERRFTTAWENAPAFGVFKVTYTVSASDAYREETHIVFIVPIFILVIALLLLTTMIIWTIILIRKRKERSSRLVV